MPALLLAVVASMAAVTIFGLADHGIDLVGELPSGLPSFAVPDVGLDDVGPLLAAAAGIAVISFADTSVLSRTFAMRGGTDVDPNRELVALGVANGTAGLFQGFPVSSSSSRTPVAEAAGARSQLTSLAGAAAVAGMLVWAPGIVRNLPSAVLAAVVIAAALSLIEVRGVVRLARAQRVEMAVSLVAFAGVAMFGVLAGIGSAIGVSLLAFIRRAWMPHSAELVRVDGLKGYHDAARHPEGRRIPGLALFRFDAPLFFANADLFKRRVLAAAGTGDRPARWVVVTAEPMTDVDATGAAALGDVLDELERRGTTLAFAELKGPVRERLERFGLVGTGRFYRTVGEAVHAYVDATEAEWTDWEDRAVSLKLPSGCPIRDQGPSPRDEARWMLQSMSIEPETNCTSGGDAPVRIYATDAVVTLPADATVQTVADELADDQIGLVVLGSVDDVECVVSERDVMRAVAEGFDPAHTPARGVGSTRLVWCDDSATAGEVAELMMEAYVRHVLLEAEGRLVGIVSARDLLGAYTMARQP